MDLLEIAAVYVAGAVAFYLYLVGTAADERETQTRRMPRGAKVIYARTEHSPRREARRHRRRFVH